MDNKDHSKSRVLKSGSYSAGITVLVIAFIVVVNIIVNVLPAGMTKFDMTQQKMYTLSEQTKGLVKGLKQDVTVYVVVQQGQENSTLMEMLEKYQSLSSKLKVETKDPAVYPGFTAEYTQEALQDNSVIVVSGKQSRIVAAMEMYDHLVLNQETSSYQLSSESNFIGEDMITSAIDYVTSENLPMMYILTGHGEQAVGSFASEIQRENINHTALNLAKEGKVPEDADCLLMEAPVSDISDKEAEALLEYLAAGGKFFYISYVAKDETPNLDRVLSEYGVQVEEGYVCEGAGRYYGSYPAWVNPEYGSHEIVSPLAKNQVHMMMAIPQNIKVLDSKPENITVTPLLRTTSSAYIKQMGSQSMSRESGDRSGVMNLAAAVQKDDTRIVIATSYDLFSSASNEEVSGGNYDFLLNAIGYLCEHESMMSIRGKQVYADSLAVTSGHTMIWIFVLMILIPIACLITGLVLWVRRRKR